MGLVFGIAREIFEMEARSRSTNSKRRIQKVKDLNRSRNNLKCASPPLDRETQLSCKCWTALEQSNDLIQLQDILLRNSLKKQKEISGKSQLGKEEYQEICRQLDVGLSSCCHHHFSH